MAKPATAEKRVRRERGSINPDDIINGAFQLAFTDSLPVGFAIPLLPAP